MGVRPRLSFSLVFAPASTRTRALLAAKLWAAMCRAEPFSYSLHGLSMSIAWFAPSKICVMDAESNRAA